MIDQLELTLFLFLINSVLIICGECLLIIVLAGIVIDPDKLYLTVFYPNHML